MLAWDDWDECENGQRARSQYVVRERIGAGSECDEIQEHIESKILTLPHI